jgi:hypothetical protein
MTAPGKNLYIISIVDSQSRMQSYRIAATTRTLAEAEACRLAGVAAGTETQTSQNAGRIDSEAD